MGSSTLARCNSSSPFPMPQSTESTELLLKDQPFPEAPAGGYLRPSVCKGAAHRLLAHAIVKSLGISHENPYFWLLLKSQRNWQQHFHISKWRSSAVAEWQLSLLDEAHKLQFTSDPATPIVSPTQPACRLLYLLVS